MVLGEFFHAIILIAVFLLIGTVIKRACFSALIVPSSLIAGLLALVLGPQFLGTYVDFSIGNQALWVSDGTLDIWKALPSYLIVVVFAGLFLGKKIPSVKASLDQSLPNLGFGYSIAIGQYIVGMLITLLLLIPLFELAPEAGALIAVGFQGGHGTVAGLQSTFKEIGFEEGLDLGLGVATIGLVSAIVLGTLMANKTRQGQQEKAEPEISESDERKNIEDRPIGLQFAILGSVIAIAWLSLTALQYAESLLFSDAQFAIFKYMPLFPVAMIVGLGLQLSLNKMRVGHWSSEYQINLISSLALDMLIVAALGSLDLSVLAKNWQAIVALGAAGLSYSALIYFGFGSWFFQKDWKIRGIGELGQSMGTTAVGLLMLKQSSTKPKQHLQAFSYKQPLYEPIVGGGIVTALAIPTIANFGAIVFTVAMTCVFLALVLSFYFYKKRR